MKSQPIAIVFSANLGLADMVFDDISIEHAFMNVDWPDIQVVMLDYKRSYKSLKEYVENERNKK